MNVNQCPACGKTAMSFGSKLAARSLTCIHCKAKLRLRFVPTAVAGLGVYLSVLFAGLYLGVTRTSVIIAIVCLLTFVVVCLFMPLELSSKNNKT